MSLRRRLRNYQASLRLVEERISEFVEPTAAPLQLVREREELRKVIRQVTAQIERAQPIEVLRDGTKLVCGPVARELEGEPWREVRVRLLTQASRWPREAALDVALMDAAAEELEVLNGALRRALGRCRREKTVEALDALAVAAARVAEYLVRVYRLGAGEAAEVERLARGEW